MAAMYSGIHLKLNSPRTQWEDKLKLARFAWISPQCLLPNKEQVLLDWCTYALTGWYHQKVAFPYNVLEGLWCYLEDLLHSKKLHSFLKQGRSVSLRHSMTQLLLDRLQECARAGSKPSVGVSTILSVCRGILSSPVLSSVFTTKYELMVDLLAKVCFLACHELQQPLLTEPLRTESVTCEDDVMSECLQTEPAANLDTFPNDPDLDSNKSFPKPKESQRSCNLFEVLLQVLSCYLSVQRQQGNSNRVFTMVTSQLIQPLVLLRHLITSGEFASSHAHLRLHHQLCKDIRVKIDTILQLSLFPPEQMPSYKEELLPCKEESGKHGRGGTKGPLNPVSTMLSKLSAEGYCELSLHYAVKSSTLPVLFKLFLESHTKGREENVEEQRMLCFYFLTGLVPILDVGPGLNQHSPVKVEWSASPLSPQSWSLALLAVESLLSQALSADTYNVAADRIRHKEVQLKFYRALAQMLFNQAQPSIPAWYRCLKVLLSLNHLILEPDLDQLLSAAWVNSDCMEARVQRARQLIVCSLLQTYTKLRQLPHFFSELLSVICQPALDEDRPPLLSEGISTSLRTCLLDAPPSQCLEICSLVLESSKRYILPNLEKQEIEVEKMEIDKGGYDMTKKRVDQNKEDASLKLFSLSQLLHAVLFSLKSLDNASPVPLVRQSQHLMEEMQQLIKKLLKVLSTDKIAVKSKMSSVQKTPKKGKKYLKPGQSENASESNVGVPWEQKTTEAALLLRYTLVEVDMCFDIHCSKYTSLASAQLTAESETGDRANAPDLSHIDSLASGAMLPARLHHPSPSCSPMSCLLLKLLTLQQMKKVMLDSALLSESSTTAQLNRAAHFILAKPELEGSLDGEQIWNRQVDGVSVSSYPVAHWYLITTNLPLISPYLSEDGVGCIADVLIGSLLSRQADGGEEHLPGSLTVSLISSQLLQSPMLAELPSLFSATVCSLTRRIVGVLVAAHAPKVCSTFLRFQQEGVNPRNSLSTQEGKEAVVEDILVSSKTGQVFVLLTDTQTKELVELLQILTNLNPDAINSEDFSSVFLLLFFMFTSASRLSDPVALDRRDSGVDAVFLVKLLRILTCLMESRNFQSVLKFLYGGSLLQAAVSSQLWHSNSGRFRDTLGSDWLDLIRAVQEFIRTLVQLIINRNISVGLNLDQFASFLTSKEVANRQIVAPSSAAVAGQSDPGASALSVHLLMASLASFSEAMASNLGRSKLMAQTLTQMLTRTSASLRPAVESVLKPQTLGEAVIQPSSILSQAFLVDVVTVLLHCELSLLSVEVKNKLALQHMTLYRGFCQQILLEMSSAPRPMDFLVSSLNFLSTFYKAVERASGEREMEPAEGNELDELYVQILQNVHRLLSASWLSSDNVSELETTLQELLRHLVEKSTTDQFNLLLLMIKDGLDVCKLRAGKYREVLSAVTIIKLLSCCQLPEPCSKALWLFAPHIISAMVLLVRSSGQDVSLTLAFTVPTVMSLTSVLRQGEGYIHNPHHVVLVLGALQSVALDHLTPHVYQSAFLCVHEALFAIIQCHPQVIPNAAPSFLNVFHRLVASIMQEGRQRGDSDAGTDADVYLRCSRLTERMFSHIAAAAESFASQSVFTVARYVTELQKVTLRPDVKLHLTEGIYRILDLCLEQDVKFLLAGLPTGVREVFNELYASYTHYHKAQRQGEDKYTV